MPRNSSDPWWLEPVAKLLAALLIFFVMFVWEFGINPANNHSVELEGDAIGVIKGVFCDQDELPWRLAITDTDYAYKNSASADLLLWQQLAGGESTQVQETSVRENRHLYVPACPGEEANIAYIWDISSISRYMFLRVHPGFEVKPYVRETPLPVLNDIGYALRHLTWPIIFWMLVLYILPFLIGEELYDIFLRVKGRQVFPDYQPVILAAVAIVLVGLIWLNLSFWIVSSQRVVIEWLTYIRPLNQEFIGGYPVYALQHQAAAMFLCAFGIAIEPLVLKYLVPLLGRIARFWLRS